MATAALMLCAAGAAEAQSSVDAPAGAAPSGQPEIVMTRDGAGHASIRAVPLSGDFTLDGKLSEAIYNTVAPLSDFVQQEPLEGQPATEKTEAWIFYDDANVYVAAKMYESEPTRRVASEMRRDSTNMFNNDHFAVLFDTFNDHRNGFGFSANRLGGLFDWAATNEQPSSNWNGLWMAKAEDFDGGWAIEMRIPFRSMRFKEGGEVWNVNLRRMVRWKNEISFLVPVPRSWGRRGLNKLSDAASLTGLKPPSKSINLDVKPYALGSMLTNRTATPPYSNKGDANFGLDAKWGITQQFVADFSYNTDFAQVEDDDAQVNLTRFSLFFPEKRDFFLEGQGIFAFAGRQSSGLNAGVGDTPYLFFSRRIGLDAGRSIPIQAGGRMTGKAGKFSIGALNVQTADDAAVNVESANFSVLRVKRDILRRSSVGAMLTHRTTLVGKTGSNDGYGVDAAFGFYQNLRMDGYVARTRTDGRDGDDTSYRANLDYNADRYGVQAERLEVGRNFNPEIGFVRRLDMRRNYGMVRFSPRPKGIPHVRRFTFQGSLNYTTNTTNRLDTRAVVAQVQTEFTNSDLAIVSFTPQYERLVAPFAIATGIRLPVGGYNYHTTHLEYQGGQQRKYSGTVLFEKGSFWDGDKTTFGVSAARVQVTPQVSLEPSLQIDWVDLKEGSFTAKVARTRATYTLTPRIYVSGIVQYNSTNASVGSNLRFRWEYRPGSEVFVVYTDDYDTVERAGVDALRNRAFVVKVNRLLRF